MIGAHDAVTWGYVEVGIRASLLFCFKRSWLISFGVIPSVYSFYFNDVVKNY